MIAYVFRRLVLALLTLVGVTALTYVVVFRIPADPAAVLAGPRADPQVIAAIRTRLQLDRSPVEQYVAFLGRLTHGDLGESYVRREPVARAISQRLPATLLLAFTGWLCWLLGGTLAALWVATRRSVWREGLLLVFPVLGVSTPTFWIGILLLYLFVTRLGWFPAGGYGTPRHLVLPAATLAVSGIAFYARLAHSSLAQTLREDYIRTAVAKGLPERVVLLRHAFRNALLPLATVAGADLAALLGGVVFTESVFDWPGTGRLAVEAVGYLDIPMIVGVVLVSASFVVLANLLVDLLYPLLDPRIRSS